MSLHRPSNTDDEARLNRIEEIANDCLVRRASGEVVSDDSIIAAHPDLMPEMGEWLHCMKVIGDVGQPDAQLDSSPVGHLRCRDCDTLVQIGDDTSVTDLSCPSCGCPLGSVAVSHSPQSGDDESSVREFGTIHTRCPHCHHQIELASDAELSDVKCASCGSSFNLLGHDKYGHADESKMVAHFKLLDQIGLGAFGSVWRALDTKLDRTVAVKIPRKGELDPTETEQFLREARSAAQLKHPNIVSVHEVGREDGQVYIVSDFIHGRTLADLLVEEQTNAREAAELCVKLAEALQHAHDAGVVHRDVKPTNIIVDRKGAPHLMDFGLAKREVGEVTMTMDGKVLGTPAYMSPEQAKGEAHQTDPRADVYSLGVVFYELLTGYRPFRGNVRVILQQVINDEPPSPRKLNSHTPRDLETICLKCLEKSPARRYQTTQALADDLTRWLKKEPIQARPTGQLERAVRWCQRRPIIASLIGTVIFVASAGFGGVLWQWQKADVARSQTMESESRLYRNAYAADMLLAQQALADNNLGLTKMLLDRYRPSNGQPDIRGFEWRYLWQQTRGKDLLIGRNDYNVLGLAISPNGQFLASASGWGGGDVRVWDLRTRDPIAIVQASGAIGTVAFGPDNRTIAYGVRAGEVVLWDLVEKRERNRIEGNQTERYSALVFLPDGRLAVGSAVGDESLVTIWDLANGGRPTPMELERTVPWVTSLAVDPHNDTTLAAAYSTMRGGQLRFWDLTTKKGRMVPVPHYFLDPQSIKFTPDGRHLVCGHQPSGDQSSTLFVLDTETGDVKARTDHAARIFDVAISHDGSMMATVGNDHTIHLWDTSTWKVVNVLKGHLHEVSSVAFSPDDSLLYSGGKDGTIREWSTSPKKKPDPVLVPLDVDWTTAAMSWDGTAFAVIWRNGRATVWDVLLGKRVAQLELPPVLKTDGHLPFAVSNKGRWLATILEDGSIGMWNVHSENEEHLTVETLGGTNHATIEFSPTEDALFVLSPNGQLDKITLPSAQLATLLPPRPEATIAHSVSFSDDGQRFAIGRNDGSVLAFKFGAGKLVSEWEEWKPHYEHVDRVTYLSDGKVVTCSRDGRIKFGDVGSKAEESSKLNPVRDAFYSMASSPNNGERLVAGTASGQVHLWDVNSQRQVLVLKGVGTQPIDRIAFPDENTLACAAYGPGAIGLVVLKVPTWEQIKAEESKSN